MSDPKPQPPRPGDGAPSDFLENRTETLGPGHPGGPRPQPRRDDSEVPSHSLFEPDENETSLPDDEASAAAAGDDESERSRHTRPTMLGAPPPPRNPTRPQPAVVPQPTPGPKFHGAPSTGRRKGASATANMAPLQLGQYQIVREIGRGGMGVVYEGMQKKLDRRVALKVLPEHLASNSALVARFLMEARAVAKFHHTNIAAIYEVGEDDGVHFFAMEFIEGRTLSDLIIKRDLEDIDMVARVVMDAARALDYAHRSGVVHRDIKPSNLMITQEGTLKIMDFGLARVEGDERLTMSGMTLGTPAYMSPEQAGSKLAGPIDHRSDVFSLGVVLYELLTLRIPFDGRSKIEILRNIIDERVPPPSRYRPDIPKDLEQIILKALRKNVEERYQSAGELANDLEKFLNARKAAVAGASTSIGSGGGLLKRRVSNRTLAIVGALLLLAGVVGGVMLREATSAKSAIRAVPQPGVGIPVDATAGTTEGQTPAAGAASTGVTARLNAKAQAGDRWGAAREAAQALRDGVQGAEARAFADVLDRIREEWAKERDALADRRQAFEAAALALCIAETDVMASRSAAPKIPAFASQPDDFASLSPKERLGLYFDSLASADAAGVASFVEWAKWQRPAGEGLGHHLFVAALAERVAGKDPHLSWALLFALAEEAGNPETRAFRLLDLFAGLKAEDASWPDFAQALALRRPALDLPADAIAWSETRPRVREAIVAARAKGWSRVDPVEPQRAVMEFERKGASAFAGALGSYRPEPTNPPRERYLGAAPGAIALAAWTGPLAERQGLKPNASRLAPLDPSLAASLAVALPKVVSQLPALWAARLELGDGQRRHYDMLVAATPGFSRWAVFMDADGDGDFADEAPCSQLYPIIPDFALGSRFGVATPVSLRFGVLEYSNETWLSCEVASLRMSGLEIDGKGLLFRLMDADSDGVFDDFDRGGARLTWRPVDDWRFGPDPMRLDVEVLPFARSGGAEGETDPRLSAGFAAVSYKQFTGEIHPADSLRMPGGQVAQFLDISPGGGYFYAVVNRSVQAGGLVFDVGSKQPVANARLEFAHKNHRAEIVADSAGRIAGAVPAGRCSLRVMADGYEDYFAEVVVLDERNAGLLQVGLKATGTP